MTALVLAVALGAGPLASASRADRSWPQFRGPGGQGIANDAELPLTWSESEGVRWKTALPGRGWSSPVAAGGRIWVTTAEERPPTAEERAASMEKVAGVGVADQMDAAGSVRLSALEVDLESGAVLRRVELFNVQGPPPIHGLNSYASPTPVIADGKVVCHFGAMGTACVDASSGEVLWRRQLEINHIVGPGSSPVVHNGMVVLTCDGADKQFVAALDLATGEPRWKVDRPPIRITDGDMRKAYCTPLLISAAGKEQLVIPGAQWFIAYNPETGEEIWRVDHGSGFSNVPRPLFDGTHAYLDTGYGKAQLWAVRVDGTGDVTGTHVTWRNTQQMPTMPSPVIVGGRIFVISDGGVASCLDAQTGEAVWRERVDGQYSASALAGAGRVYFSNHDGETTVVAASDQFEVLSRNKLDGRLMASAAAVDGDLILRTDTHLYRISDGAPSSVR
ncbi:MAG TPA: PQQ-binding-like beta-propeller repeat protein [Lacipirellulaceae bacterium]|nr:PQQ-binding-like beta-propeller repeat protein [Lacipirellulaceae bacterium]